MNLFTKQIQTHRLRDQTSGCWWEGWGRIAGEFGGKDGGRTVGEFGGKDGEG